MRTNKTKAKDYSSIFVALTAIWGCSAIPLYLCGFINVLTGCAVFLVLIVLTGISDKPEP